MTDATIRARLLGSSLAGLSSLVLAACTPSLPAPLPSTTSAPQVSATSAVTSPSAAATADAAQYAASPAPAERAGAGDGRKPDGHVAPDSGGVGDGGARGERRGRL